jgi:exopolysaccharide biosynthesis WecB/TagA/CpsF family protein
MLKACDAAAQHGIPIYLFGSRQEVLEDLRAALALRSPGLQFAGSSPSAFCQVTDEANAALVSRIKESGAGLVFVGLGCPRQEVWVFENTTALGIPAIAVGAAFDFLSGRKKQAPSWMQDHGLEWLYRLVQEPGRLWRRYIALNSLFCCCIALQVLGIEFNRRGCPQLKRLNYG